MGHPMLRCQERNLFLKFCSRLRQGSLLGFFLTTKLKLVSDQELTSDSWLKTEFIVGVFLTTNLKVVSGQESTSDSWLKTEFIVGDLS